MDDHQQGSETPDKMDGKVDADLSSLSILDLDEMDTGHFGSLHELQTPTPIDTITPKEKISNTFFDVDAEFKNQLELAGAMSPIPFADHEDHQKISSPVCSSGVVDIRVKDTLASDSPIHLLKKVNGTLIASTPFHGRRVSSDPDVMASPANHKNLKLESCCNGGDGDANASYVGSRTFSKLQTAAAKANGTFSMIADGVFAKPYDPKAKGDTTFCKPHDATFDTKPAAVVNVTFDSKAGGLNGNGNICQPTSNCTFETKQDAAPIPLAASSDVECDSAHRNLVEETFSKPAASEQLVNTTFSKVPIANTTFDIKCANDATFNKSVNITFSKLHVANVTFNAQSQAVNVADSTFDAKSKAADSTFDLNNKVVNISVDVTSEVVNSTSDVKSKAADSTFNAKSKVTDSTFDATSKVADSTFDAKTKVVDCTFNPNSKLANSTFDAKSKVADFTFDATSKVADSTFDAASKVADSTFDAKSKVAESTFQTKSKVADSTFDTVSKVTHSIFDAKSKAADSTFDASPPTKEAAACSYREPSIELEEQPMEADDPALVNGGSREKESSCELPCTASFGSDSVAGSNMCDDVFEPEVMAERRKEAHLKPPAAAKPAGGGSSSSRPTTRSSRMGQLLKPSAKRPPRPAATSRPQQTAHVQQQTSRMNIKNNSAATASETNLIKPPSAPANDKKTLRSQGTNAGAKVTSQPAASRLRAPSALARPSKISKRATVSSAGAVEKKSSPSSSADSQSLSITKKSPSVTKSLSSTAKKASSAAKPSPSPTPLTSKRKANVSPKQTASSRSSKLESSSRSVLTTSSSATGSKRSSVVPGVTSRSSVTSRIATLNARGGPAASKLQRPQVGLLGHGTAVTTSGGGGGSTTTMSGVGSARRNDSISSKSKRARSDPDNTTSSTTSSATSRKPSVSEGHSQCAVAMATLVDYVVNKLDGLSAPKLKTSNDSLHRRVEDETEKNCKLSSYAGDLEKQLKECKKNHQSEVEALVRDHTCQVNTLQREIGRLTNDLIAQKDRYNEEITMLTEQYKGTTEELNRRHQLEFNELRVEWLKQREELECETQELRDEMQAKVEEKLQELIIPYKNAHDENQSLRAVLEMRSNDLHRLQAEIAHRGQQSEQVRSLQDVVTSLQQKNEDLQEQIRDKTAEQRSLQFERERLRRSLDDQHHSSSQQQQRIEELTYLLDRSSNMNSSMDAAPSSPFNPVYTPSPTTPTRTFTTSGGKPGSNLMTSDRASPASGGDGAMRVVVNGGATTGNGKAAMTSSTTSSSRGDC